MTIFSILKYKARVAYDWSQNPLIISASYSAALPSTEALAILPTLKKTDTALTEVFKFYLAGGYYAWVAAEQPRQFLFVPFRFITLYVANRRV